MKTTALPFGSVFLLPLLLGGVITVIGYAAFTGRQLPLVSSPRVALVILLVVGMAMCTLGGINQVSNSGRWTSPLAILGYLLGAAILAVITAGLAGWKLPLIAGANQAVQAAAILIGTKLVIGSVGYLLHLF
jgi:hypothetical protein